MKKILLFLLCVLSIPSLAQTIEEKAVFDFSNPLSLNPSITPSSEAGGVSILKTFTDNGVSITFKKGSTPDGVILKTSIYDDAEALYTLCMRSTSTMTVEVGQGYLLKSVVLTNYPGDVKIQSGEKGTWVGYNSKTNISVWEAGSDEVSQVVFRCNKTASAITKVEVVYTRASTPLTLVSTDPDEGSTVRSFSSMTLQFSNVVKEVVSTSGITLSGPGISGTMSMTPSAAGKRSITCR